jgi:hypothetical protein
MLKWNEPKGPPPKWLDPSREITHDDPKLPKNEFVVTSMEHCLALGLHPRQAAGVVGNAINESAWGQSYRGNNLYGWKVTQGAAVAYALVHDGEGILWWRAPGNKAPSATLKNLKGGDPPWCFYRAFESLTDSYAEWLAHFVPKPNEPAPYGAYRSCGALFWSGREWFTQLCKVGYKGELTKRDPSGSVAEHRSLAQSALTYWAQSRLGLVVDGKWGPMSRARCTTLQIARGLRTTGLLDDRTLEAIAQER